MMSTIKFFLTAITVSGVTSTIFVDLVSSTKNSTEKLLLNSFVRIKHVWINNSSVHGIRRKIGIN